ncbi:hypothetical protein BU23DRAFT_64027 [Bimuria novae-zelandiae CBS 107.79]|uniref:Uncharacterized protein n=1 Tax=Bimuria novae-zelandiae CBS 107.79 TaxID=1447943 RepID=A0A6A5UHD2_9PLEO|nr:hypothetical protein BU23DRAFT_64027 [Bimuria novae-zelandiae CBS 107.79]
MQLGYETCCCQCRGLEDGPHALVQALPYVFPCCPRCLEGECVSFLAWVRSLTLKSVGWIARSRSGDLTMLARVYYYLQTSEAFVSIVAKATLLRDCGYCR